MAVTRSAAKTAAARSAAKPVRDGVTLQMFLWEGTDKRGKKMKGEQQAKSSNMLRAELRRQGIQPRMVKPKPKPLFGSAGKAVRSEEHTSELQSLMRNSYAVFCLKKKKTHKTTENIVYYTSNRHINNIYEPQKNKHADIIEHIIAKCKN